VEELEEKIKNILQDIEDEILTNLEDNKLKEKDIGYIDKKELIYFLFDRPDIIDYIDESYLKTLPDEDLKRINTIEKPEDYKKRVRDRFIVEGSAAYILKNEFKTWLTEVFEGYNKQVDSQNYKDLLYSIDDVISEERRLKNLKAYNTSEKLREEITKLQEEFELENAPILDDYEEQEDIDEDDMEEDEIFENL